MLQKPLRVSASDSWDEVLTRLLESTNVKDMIFP